MAPFPLAEDALPLRPDIIESFEREWEALARAGSFFTAAEQIAIAAAYRGHRSEDVVEPLPKPVAEIVRRLTLEPGTIRRTWVERLFSDGFDVEGYVEIVSVVSRIAAVDGFHSALGLPLPPLPAPDDGLPSGETNPAAVRSKAYVPMIRGTSIWWALTLIPVAYKRMEDLHNILYLSPDQMQSPGSPRQLSRPQMELIASRTSTLNECFY